MSQPAQALFQQQWQIYRTLVDENYLFHQEAYKCLHQILVEDAVQPFRFLDIACGDASASTAALKGMRIAHYHGIDLSAAALDPARQVLASRPDPAYSSLLTRPGHPGELGRFRGSLRGERSRAAWCEPRDPPAMTTLDWPPR